MRFGTVLIGSVFLLPLLLVSTSAQSAQPTLHILHDVPDDGFTFVGNPVHFGYVLLTADEKTTTHKQGRITVTQNDVVLYQTSANGDAGHDYDALNTFEIAFPTTGPYQVLAEVPASASLTLKSTFTGFVHPLENAVVATFDVQAPKTATAGKAETFTYALKDAEGDLLEHTDVLFEVRRADDGFLVFRTHTHTHDKAQTLAYAFPQAGEFNVRLTGYQAFPTKTGAMFEPVTKVLKVNVDASPSPTTSGTPAPVPKAVGSSDMVLLTSIDPQRQSNPFSQFRISTLVYDTKAKAMVPHVNFVAQVVDAKGNTQFRSESLHEYDGDFDLVINEPTYGSYTLQIAATRGTWIARSDVPFEVLPAALGGGAVPVPMPPGAAGPVILTADGIEKVVSGTPTKIMLQARTLAGTPALHSEIEIQVVPESLENPSILTNKLHTHNSGNFEVLVTFPSAGHYVLVLDAETVHGDPTPTYHYERLGGLLQVPFEVAQGPALPAVLPGLGAATNIDSAEADLPGFGLVLVLAVLAGLAVARRRA